MLAVLVAAVGAIIALLGAVVLVAPGRARGVVRALQTPRALWTVVAVRLVAGAFFVFASETCAWPMAIGTIGVLMLVAGFVGVFIGLPRIEALMDWFLRLPDVVFRPLAVIAVAFGAFIVYAAV